jgi:hypothetical protein
MSQESGGEAGMTSCTPWISSLFFFVFFGFDSPPFVPASSLSGVGEGEGLGEGEEEEVSSEEFVLGVLLNLMVTVSDGP